MARIPTYQGRVGLDTSSLTGTSIEAGEQRAEAQLFQAQAEFAQTLSRTALSVGSKLKQEEERQERNDARLWLYENASDFEAASSRHKAELEIQQDPDDYVTNADTQALGQTTFRNQRLNWFEAQTNIKTVDGKPVYNPPNKYAQQMWSEYLAKQKGNIEVDAIGVEADLRVQARYNQAERILDGWVTEVAEDHTKLKSKLADLNQFIDEHELDAAEAGKAGQRVYLDFATIKKLGEEKKQDMLRAHLDARLGENPFDVYLHIEGKEGYQGSPFGSTYGLDANFISQYRDAALRKSAQRLEQDVAAIENNANAYLANIAAGGDGGDYKQAFAAGAANQTYEIGFAGTLGAEKLKLFPGVQKRYKTALANFKSRERIAMATAGLVQAFETEIATQKVDQAMTTLRDAVKNPDIRDQFIKAMRITQDGKDAKLNSAEMQVALERAQSRISASLKLRSEDPVRHAIEVDDDPGGFANMFYDSSIEFEEKKERLDTHYDGLGQPKHNRPLLTNSQAENIVDTLQRASSGDDLIGQMKKMQEQYGDSYPRIWKQLTTMKNGLDANYAFLGSIPNSMFLSQFAEAMRVDEKSLKEFFSSSDTIGNTYSKVRSVAVEKLTPHLKAFHGDMPHRMDEVAPLVDTFIKMVALETKRGGDPDTAANRIIQMMTGSMTLVNDEYFTMSGVRGKNDEHFNFYITPDMKTAEGDPIDPETVAQNASAFFDNIQEFFDMNPNIHIPEGSAYALQNSEEMGRETYIEAVEDNGKLVMNDTGDGLMIMVPLGDEGMLYPVKYKDGSSLRPIEIPFDYFMQDFDLSRDVMEPTTLEKANVKANQLVNYFKSFFN